MSLLARFALILTLAVAAFGCQLAPPGAGAGAGAGAGDVTPNAVTGDTIQVTALDAPTAPAPLPAEATALADTALQENSPAPDPQAAAEPAPVPEAAVKDSAAASDTEATATPPEPQKSDAQLSCERKRGNWADAGAGRKICLQNTRDGGKRCTRESQCDGACLARSGTCSPVKPLLGCNEILQDDGARVTLCIE